MKNSVSSEKDYKSIDGYRIKNKYTKLSNATKLEMLKKMYQIRHFENVTEQCIIKGMVHGTCHLYVGEEATAVGAIYALRDDDFITSTHRGHGHCISKGADLNFMMAELLGKSTGYCKGKGGSMHIADLNSGNLGANGIVGGSIGIATGAGLTCKMKDNDRIVLCFFGDGAVNQGIFHESLNLASIWKLPVIYLCENNQYGISMSVKESINIKKISDRRCSYGIQGLTIDGNNIIDVFDTVSHFAEICREGNGPVIIESLTYRWKGHSKSDAQVYRSREEVREWISKDPILSYKKILMEEGILTEEGDKYLEKNVMDEVSQAVKFAEESSLPDPGDIEKDVYV